MEPEKGSEFSEIPCGRMKIENEEFIKFTLDKVQIFKICIDAVSLKKEHKKSIQASKKRKD
jgi:hypothetical protein